MNYRHVFHAGNHADVLKHVVLLACLERLKRKPAPFAVLDTHAGAGLYDLTSEAARRSPEWESGVARVWTWDAPPAPIASYVEALRHANPDGSLRFYPGSPALIRGALRPQDRLIACDTHPDEAAALRLRFRGDAQVQIHLRDGWEALGALLPLKERRGLVLIDPPYEEPGELTRAMESLAAGLNRFPAGIFLWWRPLKEPRAVERLDAELGQRTSGPLLCIALSAPAPAGKLAASSVLIANPPFGLEEALAAALPALAARLGGEALWRGRKAAAG